MRCLYLYIFFYLLIGCKTKDFKEFTNLEGEWLYFNDPNEIPIAHIGLKFIIDTLYEIRSDGYRLLGRYSISNDTIFINDKNKISFYKIFKYNLDTLVLLDGDVKFKYYNRNLEFDDNLSFNKISITAGNCFGNCSEFEMIIDKKNKRLNFYGIANCKVYGEYETILESKDISRLEVYLNGQIYQK